MRLLLTGATGFVGRALVLRLQRDGHHITAISRNQVRARELLGPDVGFLPHSADHRQLADAVEQVDGIINLAGENIFSGRWTRARRARILNSRVDLTKRLTEAVSNAESTPQFVISASAIGAYGVQPEGTVDEASPLGSDFLAAVCRAWESAAAPMARHARLLTLRIGVVLGREGGVLERLTPLFGWGLGGRLGSGTQPMSWIHLHDLVDLIARAVQRPEWSGILNAVAPEVVDNARFTQALARALNSRAFLPVPGFALKLALGAASQVVLGGQRVSSRAEGLGFHFRFPHLEGALADVYDPARGPALQSASGVTPPSDFQERTRPAHVLRCRVLIDAPVDEVWRFFAQAENLALMTPAWTHFKIHESPPLGEVGQGSKMRYQLRLHGVPMGWRTEIAAWDQETRFVDVQRRGPYALWWHEHTFEAAEGGRTRMVDTVYYRVPFGPIGRIAHLLLVGPMLRRIFSWRGEVISLRFGVTRGQRMGEDQPRLKQAS